LKEKYFQIIELQAGRYKFESLLSNYLLVAVSQAKLVICRGIVMKEVFGCNWKIDVL